MCGEINKIKNNKEAILTGEIGALLHDIGKCHPDFIKKNSIEHIENFDHANIDEFLKPDLVSLIKHNKFDIKIDTKTTNIYRLITKHHNKTNNEIIKLLKKCDQKDSADDKGVVRKKQSIENTTISSPFGYTKEKIDLNCLQKRFGDLEDSLIGLFRNYVSETVDIGCFRETLINNLKITFSHALGETRIPANDVTLWDHSYSTASLFKSILAAIVCGANMDSQNLNWRIFGICWDGMEFINRGRKIAEIQARSEVIGNIKRELKKKFENEIPAGNVIYEDTNGIYFTFPNLNDKSKDLAKECAKEALEIIYKISDSELWPFFTLSKVSKTMTIISGELKFAIDKRKIPKMTPTLFIEGEPKEFFDNPEFLKPKDKQDVCPVCKIRTKPIDDEMCKICWNRREGRLNEWLSKEETTIWIDEVADINNRVSLISLNFNLDRWLDGTMIGTIYSQSFEGWLYGKKEKSSAKSNIDILSKKLDCKLKPNKETVYNLLDYVVNNRNNKEIILDSFFAEDLGIKNNFKEHKENIENRIKPRKFIKENLATYLFTQNPSPARLYRIWRETEEFFDLVVKTIKGKIYSNKWKRIKFFVNYADLKAKSRTNKKIEDTPYIIQIKGLKPESLFIFHAKNGEFYTIESLEKFKFDNKTGEEAVKKALKQGLDYLAFEDKPDENLLQDKVDIDKSIITQEYYPLIEINKSSLSLRLVAPAKDSIKIIESITKLFNERFEKVIGKLPLNVKLLVTKRKFPLYVLLDAENRMLEGEGFKKQVLMNPWWDVNGMRNDKYYGFYPRKKIGENGKYTLDDLSNISKGKLFSLYPGYFDFDLLLGTTDRYKIHYNGKKRTDEDYKLLTARPYYFYQISNILELWDVLSNLSSSQVNFIEEMLTSKLRGWRNVEEGDKQNILRKFVKAILKDAFGDKWDKLRDETRYLLTYSTINKLLYDTIIFFRHVIKKEAGENE